MRALNNFDNYGFILPRLYGFEVIEYETYQTFRVLFFNDFVNITGWGLCISSTKQYPDIDDIYVDARNTVTSWSSYYLPPELGYYVSFVFTARQLPTGQRLNVRMFLDNPAGRVWTNPAVVFSSSPVYYPPSIETKSLTSIYSTSVMTGGQSIQGNGYAVSEKGVCYNTVGSPNYTDSKIACGLGLDDFTVKIPDLIPNTTYYVRAYARSAVGYGYGDTLTFKTNMYGVPIPVLNNLNNFVGGTADAYGSIADNGGYAITQKGFVWDTQGDPNISTGHVTIVGSGNDDFMANIGGFPSGINIWLRTFAINSFGIGYGYAALFDIASEGQVTAKVTYVILNNPAHAGMVVNGPAVQIRGSSPGLWYWSSITLVSAQLSLFGSWLKTLDTGSMVTMYSNAGNIALKLFNPALGHKMHVLMTGNDYSTADIETIKSQMTQLAVSVASPTTLGYKADFTFNGSLNTYVIFDFRE